MTTYNNSKIFNKAFAELTDLYGKDVPITILNRYYKEKALLKNSDLVLLFDTMAEVKKQAKNDSVSTWSRGTYTASFIAFLLGATDINPLPSHIVCPSCNKVTFIEPNVFPPDTPNSTCECGKVCHVDGYDLDFEMLYSNLTNSWCEICVATSYRQKAHDIILNHLSKYKICFVKDEKYLERIYLADKLDKEYKEDELSHLAHITLLPHYELQLLDEIEKATNTKSGSCDKEILARLLDKDFDGIFVKGTEFLSDTAQKTNPKTYYDFLKLLGLGNGTSVWKNNLENIYNKETCSLATTPSFREDVYRAVLYKLIEHGIYDFGLAYEVSRLASLGIYNRRGIDDTTKKALLSLGFDNSFIEFLSKIIYMSTKAIAITSLNHVSKLMWYKINFPAEFESIIKNAHMSTKKST